MHVMQGKAHVKEEMLFEAQQHRLEQRQNNKKTHPRASEDLQEFNEDVTYTARDDEPEEEYQEYTPAVVVEKDLLVLDRGSTRRPLNAPNTSSSSSSAGPTYGSSVRNVKKFRKNFVRHVEQESVMQSKYMDRVLPKESERELQLR